MHCTSRWSRRASGPESELARSSKSGSRDSFSAVAIEPASATAIVALGLIVAIRRPRGILLLSFLKIRRILARPIGAVDIALFVLVDPVYVRMGRGWRWLAHVTGLLCLPNRPGVRAVSIFSGALQFFLEPSDRIVVQQFG